MIFDVVDFYSFIFEVFLKLSLNYARYFIIVFDEDIEIIIYFRKIFLFSNNELWVKKGDSFMFDVAMGSYDGVEVCELVGLYILYKFIFVYFSGNIGLYRDDGLVVFKNMSVRFFDRTRKDFLKIFGELGF